MQYIVIMGREWVAMMRKELMSKTRTKRIMRTKKLMGMSVGTQPQLEIRYTDQYPKIEGKIHDSR